MGADVTRDTFDPGKHFSRVLFQQGRVQLDAEHNEQAAILLHYLRTLARDLIGPHGGPFSPAQPRAGWPEGGFGLAPALGPADAPEKDRYVLTPGRYYVDGVLCENEVPLDSGGTGHLLPGELARGKSHLLYLEVWEREVSSIQDDGIREVALGGPDTSLRSEVVWRVRAADKQPGENGGPVSADLTRDRLDWPAWVEQWQWGNRGLLQARARIDAGTETDPCLASPDARFRGENQLYRVEIHRGGEASPGPATFKWSRENASVTAPIRRVAGETVYLEHLGTDERTGFAPGDWVEILDDDDELTGTPGLLLQVDAVDRARLSLRLRLPDDGEVAMPTYDEAGITRKHPFLRRWDQMAGDERRGVPKMSEGAAVLAEGSGDEGWLTLEDGVQIQFQPGGRYRPGDYWLIPARMATEDIEWPDQPGGVPPHGVDRHYAPLGVVSIEVGGEVGITELRKLFQPLAEPI